LHLGRLDFETEIMRSNRGPHFIERRFCDDYGHDLRGAHERNLAGVD